MSIRTLTAAALFAAASLTTTAHAQALTDSFTYQGQLGDAGTPANGDYDITFIVYNSPIGGIAIASVTQEVSVTDGLFEAFVDFGTMGAVFDTDQTRYLELRVSEAGVPGFTVLEPRQRFAPAPVANYALRARFAEQTDTSLQDAYDNGNNITPVLSQGPVNITTSSLFTSGLTLTDESDQVTAFLFTNRFTGSGALELKGSDAGTVVSLERDPSNGGGGRLFLARNDIGASGIDMQGNFSGTQSPTLSMNSQTSPIFFNTSVTGDNTMNIPADSINAVEMLNEPGVSESSLTSGVTLTPAPGVIDTIQSVTIDCPTDGFVLVLGTAELSISHINGATSSVNLGVSSSLTSIPTNGDIETRIQGTVSTGMYDYPVTVHSLFSASQGANTYYLLGDNRTSTGSSATALDIQLTAVFIPTNYGTAGLNNQLAADLPDNMLTPRAPMTSQDILIEQNAAIIANNQRLEREVQEMKLQMQRILKLNNDSLPEQSND